MLLRIIDRLVEAVAVLCLVASTGMICANVFYRYVILGWLRHGAEAAAWLTPAYDFLNGVFGSVSVTADEVPGFLLVWIAFLGAYLAMREDGHISFDVVIDALPERLRLAALTIIDLSIAAFLVLVLLQSVRMMEVDGGTEIETADIAQGWFMAILPIAAILLLAAMGVRIARRFVRRGEG